MCPQRGTFHQSPLQLSVIKVNQIDKEALSTYNLNFVMIDLQLNFSLFRRYVCIIFYFRLQVYLTGSLVIANVGLSVRVSFCMSQFTALRIFLKFCMNVRYHKFRKVTELNFCKRS